MFHMHHQKYEMWMDYSAGGYYPHKHRLLQTLSILNHAKETSPVWAFPRILGRS